MKSNNYITPDITITEIAGRQMICAGSAKPGGDAGITEGIGENPPKADTFRSRRSVWDDEDEEDDW